MSNLQTVQAIYAAFGRGDIPAILAHLHENIEWEYGLSDVGVPWLKKFSHRTEVPGFFDALGALEIIRFEPRTLLENGLTVVALLDVEFSVKDTGRSITEEDEVHVWHFDPQGLAIRFCHKLDTHQHWLAYRNANEEPEQNTTPLASV
jgi:ketosteroid isomerase-like protein